MPFVYNPFTDNLDNTGNDGSGNVATVSGTADRITATGTTNVTIDIAATYVGQTSLTTLGTVTTGTWNATPIGPTFGGTGQTSYATGDILYASGINTLSKLSAGLNTQVLTLSGGVPSWATPTTGTVTSVSGTANRITSTGGNTPAIDIAATYVGQSSITTLGTITTGTWNATAVGPTFGGTGQTTYATGDILYASGVNTLSKLSAGADGRVLTLSGGVPSWQPDGGGTVTSVTGTANRITSTGGATPQIDIAATYVGQSSITTLGTITTGIWNGTTVAVGFGGTGQTTLTNHGVLIGQATSAIAATAAGSAGQVLQSGGGSADPTYSTATYPSTAAGTGTILRATGTNWAATTATYPNTVAQGDIIYGSATNVISALTKDTNATRYLSNQGSSNSPSWNQVTLTNGVTGTLPVANGGTGVASATAYGLLAGGTTTTNPFQSISSVASGQVLTSAGTATLPAWSASPSVTSITVGGGTALSTFVTGSWTPNLLLGGASTGMTYSIRQGFYTQIGDTVFFGFYIFLSALGSSTGNITISGFPANCGTNGQYYSNIMSRFYSVTLSAGYSQIEGAFTPSTAIMTIGQVGSGMTSANLTHTALTNTSTLAMVGQYKTS